MKLILVYELYRDELENMIVDNYGRSLDVMDVEGLNSDGVLRYKVANRGVNQFEQVWIDRWLKDGKTPSGLTGIVLQDLCGKKVVEAGDYVVDMSEAPE